MAVQYVIRGRTDLLLRACVIAATSATMDDLRLLEAALEEKLRLLHSMNEGAARGRFVHCADISIMSQDCSIFRT